MFSWRKLFFWIIKAFHQSDDWYCLLCFVFNTRSDMWESPTFHSHRMQTTSNYMCGSGGSLTSISGERLPSSFLTQSPSSHTTATTSHDLTPATQNSTHLNFWLNKCNTEFKVEECFEFSPEWMIQCRTTNLFQYAIQCFRAADVKTDEDSVRVWVGERPHVVIVWRPWNKGKTRNIQIKFGRCYARTWTHKRAYTQVHVMDLWPYFQFMLVNEWPACRNTLKQLQLRLHRFNLLLHAILG